MFFLSVVLATGAMAWGGKGHEVTIEVAKRHLTQKTKQNLAKYFSYDITKDAVWMDKHRKDKEIAYTSAWHVYNVDEKHCYDPNPRLYKGDAVHALRISDYNLSHYEQLSDSAVVMNVRMLIHFVGDLHCPTHSYFVGPRCFWPCTLNGKKFKFHGVYDSAPGLQWKSTPSAEVAEKIDQCKKSEIKKIQKGDLVDWVKDIADVNAYIYVVNPVLTETLDPETISKTADVVNTEMRNGGYRLAALLNKYFGK